MLPTNHADQAAHDSYGRRIDYLRISLTDRCNLRCIYCMPGGGMRFLPRPELLTNDELLLVVRAAAAAGFRKLRLTGGEPTLRPGLIELVRDLRAIPGIEHVTMTTNGLRLAELARPLAEAGLDRVNISFDTLDPQQFRQITRGGRLEQVWAGVVAAEAAGLCPIKLNMVVIRSLNDAEAPQLAALTLDHPWDIRFIEVMPLAGVADIASSGVVGSGELIARLEAIHGPLEELNALPHQPARRYRLRGARGVLGFISTISDPFCATCNRIRLTAEGRLRLCLLRDDELDLRAALRAGADLNEIERLIRQAVALKPWGNGLSEGYLPSLRGMSQIGG